MRILYLSFYFPPDLSAGSFRNGALVKALSEKLPELSEIDVITTVPNRYSSYSTEAPEYEKNGNVTVKRVCLPAHESGMLDQSRSFLAYACFVKGVVRDQEYDLVFASSSRLMTAVLGAYIAHSKKIPLYLDIRDIFVDTIKDVLPRRITWLVKPVFSQVEKFAFKKASRINVVSKGFLPYFDERYPEIAKTVFTNGIDDEFLRLKPSQKHVSNGNIDEKPKLIEVLYAGNVGEGQGLHNILPNLAIALKDKVFFRVIGAGGRLTQLKSALDDAECLNVTLSPPVNRNQLIEAYIKADVLFLHLNDYDAFLKVLPSKLFEYGALGKPILAGVSGYSARFIDEYLDNAQVFTPCNVESAKKAFEQLDINTAPRPEFIKHFSRSGIMSIMADDILAIVQERA